MDQPAGYKEVKMDNTLTLGGLGLIGLLCVIAAIVASGGKIGGHAFPAVATLRRQILLGGLGLVLCGISAYLFYDKERSKVFHLGDVTLAADPTHYSGRCPAKIQFTGGIDTSGGDGGTVAYRFRDEHGTEETFSSLEFLEFSTSGSKAVNMTRTVNKSQTIEAYLKIYSPDDRESSRVPVTVTCKRQA